jgi:predicted lactoylglutathione lyase
MKTKCILISLCLFFASAGFAQNRTFERFAEMDDVSSVFISQAMFRLMGNMANFDQMSGVNISGLTNKIESLQVLSTESRTRAAQMHREFSELTSAHHYEELMRVTDGGTRVGIYANMQGEQIRELLLLVGEETDFTVIRIVGGFSLQDIQQLMNQ